MLVKNPLLSIVAVMTFALGIGLTTTVYSIVNGGVLNPLPFEDGKAIVGVTRHNTVEGWDSPWTRLPDYLEFRNQQQSFSSLTAMRQRSINLVDREGRPERIEAVEITPEFFDVVRVNPVVGRRFDETDGAPGAARVAIISWDLFEEYFEGDRNALGRDLLLNGRPATVIGVMPEGFAFPDDQKVYQPVVIDPAVPRDSAPFYQVIGRLAPGSSINQAGAALATIAARLEKAYPETNENITVDVWRYAKFDFGDQVPALLFTMLGAVLGVLLIACANVANLLLAKASLRTREVAVRTALGASRLRIITQLLTETVTLAAIGSVIGLGLGFIGVTWFTNAVLISDPPPWLHFDIDGPVLVFVTGVTALSAIVAGLMPALQVSGTDVGEVLKDEGRGSSSFKMGRMSSALVVAELALSCGLLVGAGLMIKSVVKLGSLPMPFNTEDVITARIVLPQEDYPTGPDRLRFYDRLLPELAALPGVQGVALADGLPASGSGTVRIEVEGDTYERDEDFPRVHEAIITPGYFETFEVSVLQGRAFSVADRADREPVVIVNESFARRFFDGKAIGRRFRIRNELPPDGWVTVVGVVPDLYMEEIGDDEDSPVGYYIPIAQTSVGRLVNIAVRTHGEPGAITPAVRDAVARIDKNLPIFNVMEMTEVIKRETWFYGVFGILFSLFGIAALFLAAVGLFGVMSFAVGSRRHEMGIRLALGARGKEVVWLIMRKSCVELGIGLTIGLALAALATGPLQIVLFNVSARDPIVFGVIVLVLASTGIVASLIPARRASLVDPVQSLRAE